jgi:hypothetical protein
MGALGNPVRPPDKAMEEYVMGPEAQAAAASRGNQKTFVIKVQVGTSAFA